MLIVLIVLTMRAFALLLTAGRLAHGTLSGLWRIRAYLTAGFWWLNPN